MFGKAVFAFVLSVCVSTGSALAASATSLELSSTLRLDQKFMKMLDNAQRMINQNHKFDGLFDDNDVQFEADRAVGNEISTTIKFTQTYRGLEVVGQDALIHFNSSSNVEAVTGAALDTALSTETKLTAHDALRILQDRYQQEVSLSQPAQLKVYEASNGTAHLVYHLLTRSTATHNGQEIYLDAHSGVLVREMPRAYHALAPQTVYRADTEEARKPGRVESPGKEKSRAPTDIDMSWYNKVIEDNVPTADADESSLRAELNAQKVYDYYFDTFQRKSYDDKDARLVSVVHVGVDWNNAFWTSEFQFMGYGDGDGEKFKDLTHGLDVAAHEMTHAVTSTTANLEYSAESGALNESFSDFFGRMVDYEEGNWLIGGKIMGPAVTARAIRNMKNPEEFNQPPHNEHSFRRPTNGFCWVGNDYCGVHRNSGIPNRAAALITEALGKEKTEKLYYTVLTQYLRTKSDFSEMRKQTELVCAQMFSGAESAECKAVAAAFDEVRIKLK